MRAIASTPSPPGQHPVQHDDLVVALVGGVRCPSSSVSRWSGSQPSASHLGARRRRRFRGRPRQSGCGPSCSIGRIQNTTTSGSSTFAPPTGRTPSARGPGVEQDVAGRAAGRFEQQEHRGGELVGGQVTAAAPFTARMRSPFASPAKSAGELSVRAVDAALVVQRHAKRGQAYRWSRVAGAAGQCRGCAGRWVLRPSRARVRVSSCPRAQDGEVGAAVGAGALRSQRPESPGCARRGAVDGQDDVARPAGPPDRPDRPRATSSTRRPWGCDARASAAIWRSTGRAVQAQEREWRQGFLDQAGDDAVKIAAGMA